MSPGRELCKQNLTGYFKVSMQLASSTCRTAKPISAHRVQGNKIIKLKIASQYKYLTSQQSISQQWKHHTIVPYVNMYRRTFYDILSKDDNKSFESQSRAGGLYVQCVCILQHTYAYYNIHTCLLHSNATWFLVRGSVTCCIFRQTEEFFTVK